MKPPEEAKVSPTDVEPGPDSHGPTGQLSLPLGAGLRRASRTVSFRSQTGSDQRREVAVSPTP